MTPFGAGWLGALLGAGALLGVWLAGTNVPGSRKLRLGDRLEPYLRPASGSPAPMNLGEGGLAARMLSQWGAAGRLAIPMLTRAGRWVESVLGGARSVGTRLTALGSEQRVEDFRVEQVLWGVLGGLGGFLLVVTISAITFSVNLFAAAALIVLGLITGVLTRDWWLTVQVRRRERAMMEELPVVAELLALAVTAGESPVAALQRVCRLCRGELSVELGRALTGARAGASLIGSLQAIGARTSLDPLARFVDGMVIALERGTPLAEVLRAQASDVREAGKRELLASGGRREIAMMFPVVFVLLPITVLFALYPALVNITQLTGNG